MLVVRAPCPIKGPRILSDLRRIYFSFQHIQWSTRIAAATERMGRLHGFSLLAWLAFQARHLCLSRDQPGRSATPIFHSGRRSIQLAYQKGIHFCGGIDGGLQPEQKLGSRAKSGPSSLVFITRWRRPGHTAHAALRFSREQRLSIHQFQPRRSPHCHPISAPWHAQLFCPHLERIGLAILEHFRNADRLFERRNLSAYNLGNLCLWPALSFRVPRW